jgi:S1-C subfamily serine protease
VRGEKVPHPYIGIHMITLTHGKAITTAEQLQDTIEATPMGQQLRLKVLRDGRPQELLVRPTELQDASQ